MKCVPIWDTFSAVIIQRKRIFTVRLCGLIISLGYMPLPQLNRAIRYVLYVTSQQ